MAIAANHWERWRHKPRPQSLPRTHTSETFERHTVSLEEARARTRPAKKGTAQNLSLAWDDVGFLPAVQRHDGLMSEKDKKDTYYKVYIGCVWVSSAIDAIVNRFTSGDWEIEETEQGKGIEANKETLYAFFKYINDDEDFLQLLRSIGTDIKTYGEAYAEIVPGPDGLPCQIHKIDCQTMEYQLDKHGQILGYKQTLEQSNETVWFKPEQIIRWWIPDPRASKKALSPIEKMKDAVYLYQAMCTWQQKFFKQGARPNYWIELGPNSDYDEAARFLQYHKENFTGLNNAHKSPTMYGGGKIHEYGHGSIELDFDHSKDVARDEILSGYQVPLGMVGVQETAHLGSGNGESANKAFLYNVVKPLEVLIMEKLNYRIVNKAFGIKDWKITLRHADYRDDEVIVKVQDTQIRNGSLTINEARQERGRMPVDGGDTSVIVTSREVTAVETFDDLAQEHKDQVELQTAQAQAQIEKLKQPPAPPPMMQQGQQQPEQNGKEQQPQDGKGKDEEPPLQGGKGKAKESLTKEAQSTLATQIHSVFDEAVQRGHKALGAEHDN